VCAGELADFHSDDAPPRRFISKRFLEKVLLRDPYRSLLGDAPVAIAGAQFGTLDFHNTTFSRSFSLDHSTFDGPADFTAADVRTFSCYGCVFRKGIVFANSKAVNVFLIDTSATAIDISGAQVTGVLDLSADESGVAKSINAASGSMLYLDDVEASGLRAMLVDVRRRHLGTVDFGAAHISGNLLMSGVVAKQVVLIESRIDETLNLTHVDSNVIDLRSAVVGRSLLLTEIVAGRIKADAIDVGQDVLLTGADSATKPRRGRPCSGHDRIGWIDLSGARVAGSLDASQTRLGRLDARSAFVRLNVALEESCVNVADLSHVHAGGDLYVIGSSLSTLLISGATVEGLLVLDTMKRHMWSPPGSFVLRDASVRVIEDRTDGDCEEPLCDPWPEGCLDKSPQQCVDLDLRGFTYSTLGIRSGGVLAIKGTRTVLQPIGDMAERRISRWRNILNRTPYSQQPYEQLASVLKSSGRPETATAVLYESKNREAATVPWWSWRYAYLMLTKALIGYGYYPMLATAWAVAIIGLGVFVLERTGQHRRLPHAREPRFVGELVYSFDVLIPLITLRKADDEVVLHGFARYYFYAQKIFGYLLATFLLAGLSGLTK
jgi:hypothetical protein